MNKLITSAVVAVVFAGGLGFYGGMLYGKNSAAKTASSNFASRFQGMNGGQIPSGTTGNRTRSANQSGSGFISGEIIAKDDQSVTVKQTDGGSKIIFYSGSTEVSKFASGSATDLKVGDNISASGKANTDGSVTAQMIQLRPERSSDAPKPPAGSESVTQ